MYYSTYLSLFKYMDCSIRVSQSIWLISISLFTGNLCEGQQKPIYKISLK